MCKLINVHPDSADQHGILIVHIFGDHYNGRSTVISSIISPPHVKEPRWKYTAEQLENFAVYPPHTSRNLRFTGERSWWWCWSTVEVITKTDLCKTNTLCGF